jgi:hypothetical protein
MKGILHGLVGAAGASRHVPSRAGRLGEMVLTATVPVPVHDMLRSVLRVRSPILLYRFLPPGFISPPTDPWDDKAPRTDPRH